MPLDKAGLVRLIKIAQRELRLSDDVYRDMLRVRYKVTSSTQLTPYQASTFLDELKRLGFKVRPARQAAKSACHPCRPRPLPIEDRPGDDVRYAVTPTQLADIAQLRANITWKSPTGYQRWLLKFHHIPVISDSLTAGKVIAGLRGICMAQHGCRACGDGGACRGQGKEKKLVYGPLKVVEGGRK
jgi:hypothetical protein